MFRCGGYPFAMAITIFGGYPFAGISIVPRAAVVGVGAWLTISCILAVAAVPSERGATRHRELPAIVDDAPRLFPGFTATLSCVRSNRGETGCSHHGRRRYHRPMVDSPPIELVMPNPFSLMDPITTNGLNGDPSQT